MPSRPVLADGPGPRDPADAEEASLITAAYRALVADGPRPVSVAEILSEAGLGTRAFYRHFRSKDELLLAMFRADSQRALAELEALVEAAPNPRTALEIWVDHSLALVYEPKRLRRVRVMVSEEVRRAAGYAAEWVRTTDARRRVLIKVLETGKGDGIFPASHPEGDAWAITAMLGHVIEERTYGLAGLSRKQARDHVLGFALRALLAGRGPGLTK